MDPNLFTDAQPELAVERRRMYQGTVQIDLDQIVPHPSCRKLNKKNVDRLCNIFQKETCRRLDLGNQLTAVVCRQHLEAALRTAGIQREKLSKRDSPSYSKLQFAVGQVQYISPNLQTALIDEYSNERTPSDGEVYCKVRQYQREANAEFEEMWMGRLSRNKARRFQSLSLNKPMRAAFDGFLPIPGILEQGLRFPSLPWVLAASADEEVINALDNLRAFWSSLIDAGTIERLQLHAPGVSDEDRETVHGWISSGQVFSNFTESERADIWNILKDRKTIIPSLYTFFQNMRYLAACANCMKRLVSFSKYHCTIKTAMLSVFKPSSKGCSIQTSETSFRNIDASPRECAEIAYEQLWIYSMRHYSEMAKESESDDVIAKPGSEKPDESLLYHMALLARKLGFDSDEIQELLKHSPDRQIAKSALLKARPPERYQYNKDIFESLVDRIVESFESAVPASLAPTLTLNKETKLGARRGFPPKKDKKNDRPNLFLDQLHTSAPPYGKVTSFFVRQCVYFTFFGKISRRLLSSISQPDHDIDQPPASPLFVPEAPNPYDDETMSDITTSAFEAERQREEAQRRLEEQRRQEEQQAQRQLEEQRRQEEQLEEQRKNRPVTQVNFSQIYDELDGTDTSGRPDIHQDQEEEESRKEEEHRKKEGHRSRPVTQVHLSQFFETLDSSGRPDSQPRPPDTQTRQEIDLDGQKGVDLGKRRRLEEDEEPNKRPRLGLVEKMDPSQEFAFVTRDDSGELTILQKLPLDEALVTSWAKKRSKEQGARFLDRGHRVVAPQNCFTTGIEDGLSIVEVKEPRRPHI
ncbi:uncharacterized protein BJX67DRAFT_388827 [Aspergillus lucknowensis]|uniref:Uncharacterized protein n=1 Tax=Aspergillus lucknowensis TaxID=176173 RepID=A0ABR4LNQ0_9EURO